MPPRHRRSQLRDEASTGGRQGFARLWTAHGLSQLGDQLLGVALALYVLDASGSAALSMASVLVNVVPGVLFGALAGVVVDRCDRRRVLVWASVGRALLVLPLLLLATGAVPVVWVLPISFLKSSVAQVMGPAVGASLPSTVTARDLPRANSRIAATGVVLQLTAPALGALLYTAHGLDIAVLCNAAAYLVAAVLWSGMPRSSSSLGPPERVWASGMTGVRLVRDEPVLSRVLLSLTTGLIGVAMQAAVLVPFVRLELLGSANSVGLLSSLQGVGALAAATAFPWLVRQLGLMRVITVGMCGLPVATLAFLLSDVVTHAYPGVIASGLLLSLLTAASQVHIQQNVSSAFLGRVLGIIGATIAMASVLGTTLALLCATWLELRTVLVVATAFEISGVLYFMAPALALRAKAWTSQDDRAGGGNTPRLRSGHLSGRVTSTDRPSEEVGRAVT